MFHCQYRTCIVPPESKVQSYIWQQHKEISWNLVLAFGFGATSGFSVSPPPPHPPNMATSLKRFWRHHWWWPLYEVAAKRKTATESGFVDVTKVYICSLFKTFHCAFLWWNDSDALKRLKFQYISRSVILSRLNRFISLFLLLFW